MSKSSRPLHIITAVLGDPVALVSGGAGFLGSHLCAKLLTRCRVVCLDNLRFGKREYITPLLQNDKFTFLEYDIARPLTDLLRKRVDYIFHIAGVDEVERREKASLDNLLVNTYGTRNLLEKAVSDGAKFLLVSTLMHQKRIDETMDTAQARLFSESFTAEYIKKFGLNGRVIRVGDLFGPRMPLDTKNPISMIIGQLLKKGEVKLVDEMARIYPVYVSDAVDIILQTMFGPATSGKIFNLIPSQSITLLELSHMLEEIEPRFSLRFAPDGHGVESLGKVEFSPGSPLSISTKEQCKAQIAKTLQSFQKDKPSYIESPIQEKQHNRKSYSSLGKYIVIGLFLFFLFTTIFPALAFGVSSILAVAKFNAAQNAIKVGKLSQARGDATASEQLFVFSQSFLGFLSPQFALLQQRDTQQALLLLLKTGERGGLVLSKLSNASISLNDFFRKSSEGKGIEAKPLLDSALSDFNTSAVTIAILEKELAEVITLPLPDALVEYIRGKQVLLEEQQGTISLTQTLANLLPDLLGFDDKRTYLILFENNMELRPGGGFIGSYGLVSFEKGSLISFDVYDVYQADGQLRGHVEPPLPIRKYLNQPNWFLRDSNWDPDFQSSAAQTAWFLQKEVGTQTHGVIVLDVTFMQFLLEAIGPVTLSDYKETITAENLFEKAQIHAEKDFFPGSTQKKDFLGALARRLIDRLLKEGDLEWLSVISALRKGLVQKHMLFSFNNPSVQQVFNLNNWGGTILMVGEQEGKYNDFRMLTEANLGVNKANAFVTRKVHDDITVGEEGDIEGKLSIIYTNTSTSAWPGGPYINYLRILFPQKTEIVGVSIDGKEASVSAAAKSSKEKTVSQLELDEASQSGKSVFGLLLTVPPNTTKEVTFSYELSRRFPKLAGSTTYSYIFQKQPGVKDDPLTLTLHYPAGFHIKTTNAQVFKEGQSLTLSTNLSEDRLFEVEFLR